MLSCLYHVLTNREGSPCGNSNADFCFLTNLTPTARIARGHLQPPIGHEPHPPGPESATLPFAAVVWSCLANEHDRPAFT